MDMTNLVTYNLLIKCITKKKQDSPWIPVSCPVPSLTSAVSNLPGTGWPCLSFVAHQMWIESVVMVMWVNGS